MQQRQILGLNSLVSIENTEPTRLSRPQ